MVDSLHVEKVDSLPTQELFESQDSIAQTSANDSKPDSGIDYAYVDIELDTSQFFIINEPSIIVFGETSNERRIREEEEAKYLAIEEEEKKMNEERARKEWESQPHDSSEVYVYEDPAEFLYQDWTVENWENEINMAIKNFSSERMIPYVTITNERKKFLRFVDKRYVHRTYDIGELKKGQGTLTSYWLLYSPEKGGSILRTDNVLGMESEDFGPYMDSILESYLFPN